MAVTVAWVVVVALDVEVLVAVFGRTRCLDVQDCTFTARLPYACSQTQREPGSRSYPAERSTAGCNSAKPSLATSRAPTRD
jgi:hypothetical protein